MNTPSAPSIAQPSMIPVGTRVKATYPRYNHSGLASPDSPDGREWYGYVAEQVPATDCWPAVYVVAWDFGKSYYERINGITAVIPTTGDGNDPIRAPFDPNWNPAIINAACICGHARYSHYRDGQGCTRCKCRQLVYDCRPPIAGGADLDQHAVRELDLYAENTSELYPQFRAIIANLQRKIARGAYDPTKAPKLWRYWYDAAAKRYQTDVCPCTFTPAVRQAAAEQRAADEYQKILNGEYTARH